MIKYLPDTATENTDNNTRSGSAFRLIKSVCFFFVLLGLAIPVNAIAQNGILRGEVKDASTGESLIGANVILKGTNKGTATDVDGRYVIRNLPVGEHVFIYRYIGYETKELTINIEEEQSVEQNVELASSTIMGEEVEVTARQRGQARALSEQRKSVNIKNVISAEQIEAFADNTVTGALSRIAGMGHGGANIRGVGAGASNVTMDGQRMGATGSDRSVDLSTISADMVQSLEVIKVITPDMDADALAGVINIDTRRPVGGERSINSRIGGGFQDRYLRYLGTQRRASVSYGDSPNDNYSFGLNFSYQRDPNASETFRTDWESRCFENCNQNDPVPKDILSDIGSELEFDVRDRYGAGMQFTFQPSEQTTYHLQGMFNFQDSRERIYSMAYQPRMPNYTAQTQTGSPDGQTGGDAENQGTIGYYPRLDEAIIHQYTVQAGGRHRFDSFDLDYKLGWGHGRFSEDQYRMNFQTSSDHEFIFNLDDRYSPTVEVAPWSRRPQFPTASFMTFDTMDHRINSNVSNDLEADIDIEMPYQKGKIKFGSSAAFTFKRGIGERYDRGYSSRLNVGTFRLLENGHWEVFDRQHQTYSIPWLVDLENAKEFYITQAPRFPTSLETLEQWVLSTETSKYNANENTFAAYGMADLNLGFFTLLGGLRVEHTVNTYTGREATINQSGAFEGAIDITNKNNYTNFFPNLQTVFRLGDFTNFRMAYSRSIGRPTFDQLNPYVLRNYDERVINQGNPDLDPMLSNNFDALFEHYFTNVGQITAGLFYKDMRNFIYEAQEQFEVDPDDPDALDLPGGTWDRFMPVNGRRATVYGFEFTWQQNLEFLPGFLSNLGTYTSYSYAQSIADLGRVNEQSTHGLAQLLEALGRNVSEDYKEITPLSGQRPHVINAGLDYENAGFSAQITYQWSAAAISSYNDEKQIIPIYGDVYYDRYDAASKDLSLTVRYWISPKFQIWLDGSNIMNNREIDYYYNQDLYPATTTLEGRELTMGLRYRL